jgi:hypothetical protein
MKKVLPGALLLLLSIILSGSLLMVWANPAPSTKNLTTSPSASVLPVETPMDQTRVPGITVPTSATPAVEYMNMGPTDPTRIATYWVPPIPMPAHSGPMKPREITPRDFYFNVVDVAVHDKMFVKFTEESRIRWSNGHAYSKTGASTAQLESFLARHPEITMNRELDEIPEATLDFYETNGERNINQDLANLNNFYVLKISDNPDPMTLITEASKIDIVETVFYQPKGTEATCNDIAPATADFSGGQTYMGPAPLGVDAIYAGNYHYAGRGHWAAWTCDIEWNWTEGHEDFNQDVPNGYGFEVLNGGDGGGTADHGDACSGIIGACNNGFGMTGESYTVTPKGVSVASRSWASAIGLAQGDLYVGESMFIEIHAEGPYPGYDCNTTCGNCDQYRYIAIEYWDDNFTAIQTAVANNRIVYEAGGNGQMNLDNAVYANRFQRWFRDSGAILVGATNPTSQVAECWSSYGSRIDLNGWGEQVYSLGYGYLYNPTGNRNQMYTNSFGGTSSATPIVTAAGNCLQGIAQEKYGITMTPGQMRTYLAVGGTPYSGSHAVGPRPNLVNAINAIEPDVAPYNASGWYSACVPRNNNTATPASCGLAGLDGNTNNTYLNVYGMNYGFSPAPDSSSGGTVETRLYLDGEYIRWINWGRINPSQGYLYNNAGAHTVRGGRHTIQWTSDPLNTFAESNEDNNTISQQFVWSPLQRNAYNSILVRSAPPVKYAGSPSYQNGDGFRGSGVAGTYWLGFALLPQSGNDIDAYCYEDAYSVTSGFEVSTAASSRGSSSTDLVIVNGNSVGAAPSRLFQAIRYSDASSADYASEVDAALTESWNPPYNRNTSLGADEIMDMYEIYLTAGTSYYIGAHDISGGLDLTVAVYGQTHPIPYYSFYGYRWASNGLGIDGNEYVYPTVDSTGWYVAVVMKSGSESYGQSGWYTFSFLSSPAADLEPRSTRPGWSASMVVRNTNDATETVAVIPATLNGNATNYYSMTWYNNGGLTAVTGASHAMQLDGAPVTSWIDDALPPFSYDERMNAAFGTIRGGRHTISFTLDNGNVVPESDETDNSYSAQYVWSPMALTRGVAVGRNAPPPRGSGAYYNSDGFSFTLPSNVGNAVAVLSPGSAADYDLYDYSDYSGTYNGYSTLIAQSAYAGNVADYVVIPYRLSSNGYTYYPAAVNYNSASDSAYVEAEHTQGRISTNGIYTSPNPDTILSHEVFNLYEIRLIAGQQYRLNAVVLSGTADIAIKVFRDSLTVQTRSMAVATANSATGGGSETLLYTPTVTDYYIVAVEKAWSSSANLSSIYNMTIGPNVPGVPPVDDLVIEPWSTSNQVRIAWRHIPADSSGTPLTGRRYVIYRNTGFGIVPLPADSIGGTTDSTFIDTNASGSVNFYRVKVKAN